MNQIELHKKIDQLLKVGPETATVDLVSELISANNDAKRYFFATADERWLDWLLKNGFLDAIKKRADDPSRYSYRIPELDYLASMAEKEPKKVADIILDTPISKDNFNPEVIDRFLWICSSLPAEQIARLAKKIRDEKWIQLMNRFNRWGFDYEKMMEKLFEAGDYKNMLVLAEAVLAVRTKEEIKEMDKGYSRDNLFYFDDLGHTKIFEYLVGAGEKLPERALDLTTTKMREIIMHSDKKDENKIFDIEENFYLFDVDFFNLEIDSNRNISSRDNVKNLAAAIKKLAENEIGKCEKEEKTKELYEKYINSLPFSRSMWRLRLFVLSLCPEVFKEELKNAFFKIFENDYNSTHELISVEYYKLLKNSFYVLSEEEKRKYIEDVIHYFSQIIADKDVEKWCKRDGLKILSCIESELNIGEKEKAEKVLGGKINKNFKPEPEIGPIRSGFVSPKPPVDLATLGEMPIAEIVENLKSKWTPENLYKMDTKKDFLEPLNAEGMGELLKQDMTNRPELYINNADLFFDRDKLNSHYTYSFLRGVYDVFKQGKFKIERIDKFFELFKSIADSGGKKGFTEEKDSREKFDAWLAGWNGVHDAMADNLKAMLGENDDGPYLNIESNRDDLLKIITYLLSYPDPKSEDNIREHGNDPFADAINSVRGRAFEILTLFIYLDGKKYSKEEDIKIDGDVKKIYEEVLDKEDTFAVMFLFGYYLPSYYYRDKKWVISLKDKIFPKVENKKDLFLAAWEGYLSTNLYKELFEEFEDLYRIAIKLKPEEYTKRKYSKELDEGLAIHLALAFMHFNDFIFESELFKLFWATPNQKSHEEFIAFIGRYAISRDNGAKFMEENHISLKKLKDFWDWALGGENIKDNKPFGGFGYWMKYQDDVFEPKWMAEHIYKTLEKGKGKIDWDYAMVKSIALLADKAPEETLKILQVYLLNQIQLEPFHATVYIDDFMEAMRVLYKNEKTQNGVYNLINELIEKGSNRFWKLKEIVKQNEGDL